MAKKGTFHEALAAVRAKHGVTQAELAARLRLTRRTVSRWEQPGNPPSSVMLSRLLHVVNAIEPASARELARAAGLPDAASGGGEVAAAAAPAPLWGNRAMARFGVESVVCAAAEALEVPPGRVRAVLLAAFSRAREMGLSVEQCAEALEETARRER